jgi:dipeptidase D
MIINHEPKKVFEYFEKISSIPHGSNEEKALSDYIKNFATERNLEVYQDDLFNLVIKKGGTKGYENSPAVIIQGHIDMVCEKNEGTEHDFSTEPIKIVVEGDLIKASSTTLGADNGIAVAMAMELLDSKTIPHPPLEIVLTVQEETGMFGVIGLDVSMLKAKTFINADSGKEGYFYGSCSGGRRSKISMPVQKADVSKDYTLHKIELIGLEGGHSGVEINEQRGNSNVLMGRVLNSITKKYDVYFGELNGGLKENAIPREATTVIAVKPSELEAVKNEIKKLEETFKKEHRVSDPNLQVSVKSYDKEATMFSKEFGAKVLTCIALSPNNVSAISLDIKNLVETSSNLGVVKVVDGVISFEVSIRSSLPSKKVYLTEKLELLAQALGAEIEITGDYPGWAFNNNSNIRDVFVKSYKELFNKEPEITAIHAGLECGLFAEKLGEDIDMISFGPDMSYIHTPDEEVSISSSARTWDLLVSVLEKLK